MRQIDMRYGRQIVNYSYSVGLAHARPAMCEAYVYHYHAYADKLSYTVSLSMCPQNELL